MARSSFYYHLKKLQQPDKYEEEKEVIREIFHHHKGRYGYRRVCLELAHRGYHMNHKVVLRLMKECGVQCRLRMKKYSSYRGERGKGAPNILAREFYTDSPNSKWATDVTEFRLSGGKLYLSPIIDLYNGEIICYNLSRRADFKQTMNMLNKALRKVPIPDKLILHSDQGWQYRMSGYCRRLEKKGIRQSMSEKGNPLDNAVMENFFGILKSELFYAKEFESLTHLEKEIREYIKYYNNERIKLRLNGLSPIQYRLQSNI